jgi:hypothetical protein
MLRRYCPLNVINAIREESAYRDQGRFQSALVTL